MDWLNVTFPIGGESDPLGYFLENFYSVAGLLFGRFEDRGGGLHGWKRSFAAKNGGAMFAFGGQGDTAFLSLSGAGCALVENWGALGFWLREVLGARISRLDGAVDDFGGVRSVDHAVEAYKRGEFKAGGRQPSHDLRGDWLDPKGKGRTLYVGRRESGKVYRAYEKGKQLGDPDSLWVRHEVELHSVDRVIPWEAFWDPGPYVAGAFPYLRWVSGSACRIKTVQRAGAISLESLQGHCQRTYGKLIATMRRHGATDREIVDTLNRDGTPQRLIVPELVRARWAMK